MSEEKLDNPTSHFCSSCGKPLPQDAKFCQSCGQKVNEKSASPKRSFIVRWGPALLFITALICFFIAFSTLVSAEAKEQGASIRMIFGVIYLAEVVIMFILSFVRIFKKYHIVRSILWILIVLILLFIAPGILAS